MVVSISTDGGETWGKPVVVGGGLGDDFAPVQIFNDKEWIVVDTDPDSPYYGRTYLTWTAFRFEQGAYIESPILEAHSDDGGLTWSAPQEISGSSSSFCTFQTAGDPNECDEDQGSVPTVAPGGVVYVAFLGSQDEAAWEEGEVFEATELVVKSTDGGVTWSAPIAVDPSPADQWFPWADVSPTQDGVGIVYNQRSETDPHLYDIVLATGAPGAFSVQKVNSVSSNPFQSMWFRARVDGCWLCTAFQGDYIRLAHGSDGSANMVWTDMRRLIKLTKNPGYGENIFFARR